MSTNKWMNKQTMIQPHVGIKWTKLMIDPAAWINHKGILQHKRNQFPKGDIGTCNWHNIRSHLHSTSQFLGSRFSSALESSFLLKHDSSHSTGSSGLWKPLEAPGTLWQPQTMDVSRTNFGESRDGLLDFISPRHSLTSPCQMVVSPHESITQASHSSELLIKNLERVTLELLLPSPTPHQPPHRSSVANRG